MPNREKPGRRASGWAPAKLILFGEHAVGYGEPALGISLSKGVHVELRPGHGQITLDLPPDAPVPSTGGPTPEALASAALGEHLGTLEVSVNLEVPPRGGLGTSAALAIALLRARRDLEHAGEAEDLGALYRDAKVIEDLAHGRSSGLDPALVLHGPRGPIWFRVRGLEPEIEVLPEPSPTHFVIGMKAPHGGTARSVDRVADLKQRHATLHEGTMRYLGHLAEVAKSSLLEGDVLQLGFAMDLAHGVLAGLGLVSPEVDQLLRRARASGALGAKMTGAGGVGGAFYALAPDAEVASAIAREWRSAGAFVLEELHPRR